MLIEEQIARKNTGQKLSILLMSEKKDGQRMTKMTEMY